MYCVFVMVVNQLKSVYVTLNSLLLVPLPSLWFWSMEQVGYYLILDDDEKTDVKNPGKKMSASEYRRIHP